MCKRHDVAVVVCELCDGVNFRLKWCCRKTGVEKEQPWWQLWLTGCRRRESQSAHKLHLGTVSCSLLMSVAAAEVVEHFALASSPLATYFHYWVLTAGAVWWRPVVNDFCSSLLAFLFYMDEVIVRQTVIVIIYNCTWVVSIVITL